MKTLSTLLLLTMAVACGGETKPADQPTPVSSSPAPTMTATASATPAASASAAPSASTTAAPEPAPPKTKFLSFAKSANFGKVDKVGAADGSVKADGVKDLVFDAEIDGAANALLVMSTDNDGIPTGDLGADTFVGTQTLPADIAANLNMGKNTAGLVAYEGDKLVNGKDGSLTLSEGKHKLTLYLSIKNPPKDAKYVGMAYVDGKLVKSTVAK